MEAYTIEQLHQMFKEDPSRIKTYYMDLFDELTAQQQRTNALVRMTREEALAQLDKLSFDPDDPLSCIPMIVKDNFSTKGVATTASSRMLENYVPFYNATVIDRLYAHGAVMVGKSSMDELAMGGTNKSALTGPVRNPWNLNCIPGGSSGGSAALVASGAVPFALGSDTGDSIRKPAGFCGVVGFKPTWGRISRYGVIPYASSLDHVGAFTRSVADMAIVMEAMAGRDDHDMTSSNRPVPAYYQDLSGNIQGMRIAVIKNICDEVKNPDMLAAMQKALDVFRAKGAVVDEVEMDQQLLLAALPVYTIIANSEATSNHSCLDGIKYGLRVAGETADEVMINSRTAGFSDYIKRRFVLGNLALATENQERMFRKAQRVRRLIVDELNRIYENYDLIVTPVSGNTATPLEEATSNRLSNEYVILENNMVLGNFAGTPSLSLPLGFTDGMPFNIHLMGRIFEEQTVLNAGYALEAELGLKNQCAKGDQ